MTMKPETYVKRAFKKISKKRRITEQDETLAQPFHGGTYLLGSDGIRAHMVQGEFPFDRNSEQVDLKYPANDLMKFFERGRSAPTIAEFSPGPVVKVCKAADAIHLDNSTKKRKFHSDPAMRITLNGSMDFITHEPANGTMRASLEDGFQWKMKSKSVPFNYDFKADGPLSFWINAKYLREALAGIKTDVCLRYDAERQMVYLADTFAEHEAVVMCLLAKEFEAQLARNLKDFAEDGSE